MARPQALRALALPVIAGGTLLFATFMAWPVPLTGAGLLTALFFTVLALGLVNIEISFGGKVSLTPEISAVVLALLLGGPGAAAIAAAVASGWLGIKRKRSLMRTVYTPAQFILALGVFTLVYLAIVGHQFGPQVPARVLDGDVALGVRYALAVLLGTALYVLVNDAFILGYIALESGGAGLDVRTVIAGDVGGSLALMGFVLPVAFGVGAVGPAALLFALPVIGAVWGGVVFVRARLTGGAMPVATRLTAFFTVAVGSVFVLLSAVVLGTFVRRYTAARIDAEDAFARGMVVGLEDALGRGETLQWSPVSRAAVQRAMDDEPALAYAVLQEMHGGERRTVIARYRGGVDALGPGIERELAAHPDAPPQRWDRGGADALRVRDVRRVVRDRVGNPAGELHLGLDLAPATAEVQSLALKLGVANLLLFALLLLALRRYADRGLVRPLGRVGTAMGRIASGDADLSERLPVEGDAEIAALGTHFNLFADRLTELVATTARATHVVAGGAGEVAASGQELAASSASVADSMSDAVGRLERERAEADALHRVTSELAELNAGVAEQAEMVAGEAADVVRLAERNRAEVGRAGDALLEVREVVRESTAASAELIDAARQIEGLVKSIRQIADQTNLLALNAAIEAARAGDHGRGFAVVAEEVRKLADGSADATTRAAELIGTLRGRINRVVAAMKRGGDRVEGVERISAQSREALAEIIAVIERMDGQISGISASIGLERQLVGRVDAQVTAIERLIGENAAMATEVGAATEEQTASIEQMSNQTVEMVHETEMLRALIGRFRLPDTALASAGADAGDGPPSSGTRVISLPSAFHPSPPEGAAVP